MMSCGQVGQQGGGSTYGLDPCAFGTSLIDGFLPNPACYADDSDTAGELRQSVTTPPPPCDPGWVDGNLRVTAFNGKQYSGADIDLAARILYAESSTNQDERNAVASVEINRTLTRGFGKTFAATAGGYQAVYDNKKAFTKTADGNYQNLNALDCASLTAAIETMLGTVVSGPSYSTYLYFVAATVGPGDVHGKQRFSASPFSSYSTDVK